MTATARPLVTYAPALTCPHCHQPTVLCTVGAIRTDALGIRREHRCQNCRQQFVTRQHLVGGCADSLSVPFDTPPWRVRLASWVLGKGRRP